MDYQYELDRTINELRYSVFTTEQKIQMAQIYATAEVARQTKRLGDMQERTHLMLAQLAATNDKVAEWFKGWPLAFDDTPIVTTR